MRIYATLIIIVLLTACSPVSTSFPTPSEAQSVPDAPEEVAPKITSTPSTPYDSDLQSLIEKAKLDLAQRLNISEAEINVISTIDVVWPDSSLGCPQPRTAYTQALTDGFLIRLEAGGELYEYHTNTNTQVIFCEFPEFPVIPVTPGEIDDGQPWVPVD